MKVDHTHQGKLFQLEREKRYKQHLQRIHQISSKRQILIKDLSPLKKQHLNGFKIQKIRKQKEQNLRLMRKLSQIGKRKSNFISGSEEERYYTLNLQHRQMMRKKKQHQIQVENDSLVQRIVQRLSRQKIEEFKKQETPETKKQISNAPISRSSSNIPTKSIIIAMILISELKKGGELKQQNKNNISILSKKIIYFVIRFKIYYNLYKQQIQIFFKYLLNKFVRMFSSKSDYDRGINTFSPQGRIFQVQYAIQAIKLGSSAVGIKVREGVVLAVERRLNSTLIIPESIQKIFEIDEHICCAASGVITDSRTLIEHARVESLNHRYTYLQPITVKALTQTISDMALNFGQGDPSSKKKPMSRPYGVALLIAGVDENGPCIYQTDPSGTMIQYKAKGIGAADQGIQSILNQKYNQKMSLEDAQKLALTSLKETMEEKISKNNVQVMVISTLTKKVQRKTAEQIGSLLQTIK